MASFGKTTKFGRTASLIVDNLDLSDLDFDFKAIKSLKAEPNTLDLTVYNLNPQHRQQLQRKPKVIARLEAGYRENNSQLFLGEIRSVYTTVDNTDKKTKLSCGDSEEEIQKSRCAVTFGAQVPIDTALRSIFDTLNLNKGNLDAAISRLKQRGISELYPKGAAFYGNSWRILQDFARSAQLEISIQDGHLLVLDLGATMQGKAVLLSPATGLLGSPTIDADGTVNAVCLIEPNIVPGRVVVFDSESVQGSYRVYHLEANGEKRGDTWNYNLVCQPLVNNNGQPTGK